MHQLPPETPEVPLSQMFHLSCLRLITNVHVSGQVHYWPGRCATGAQRSSLIRCVSVGTTGLVIIKMITMLLLLLLIALLAIMLKFIYQDVQVFHTTLCHIFSGGNK